MVKPKLNDTSLLDLGNKKFGKLDTSYTSFWLYNKERDILSQDFQDKIVITDPKIFSEFNPTLAKNVISYWSEKGDLILDPFAGRSRGFIAGLMGRGYYGFEIVKDTYEYLIEPREEEKNFLDVPIYANDDSFNIDKYEMKKCQLIFSCPPYYDIEKYKSCDGQLTDIAGYDQFLTRLSAILFKSIEFLEVGKYMILVVGDFRKNGKYYTFHSDLMHELELDYRIVLHDLIVVQNIPFHVGAIYFGNMKKTKRVSKVHEYILVYKKVKD